MKIAVLGATGWIGSTIKQEALGRGHQVIAISRTNNVGDDNNVEARTLDLISQEGVANAVQGADVVIVAIGGRAKGNHDIVPNTASRLLEELPATGVKRLLWVGGAGSLEAAPGLALIDTPNFPAEFHDEARAQGEALTIFKASDSDLNWVFVSPAAEIFPGERTGEYRTGGDQLLTDSEGNCRISVEDFAVALIDEAEKGVHQKKRISIAY
ncbi:NAD(P)-dependent oxidoreductase [Kistimonas asteriae]|uniref:NAD(P)-dependent oxidoreductase n=1 Tax=Kistimonas asteriae TaxID=517724 RepID=UPI001BA4FBCC|nr:NAD(P)-dependent oxidoreductase [Kistimonas asteriae]